MTAPTTRATETVARALAANPDGITTRGLADKAGVSPATVSKTLNAMEADGTAHREPGSATGNRRPADVWYPTTSATDDEAATPATTDDAPADTTPSRADETSADETSADTASALADETPADTTATPADEKGSAAEAVPVSAAPVVSRQDYMRVLIMAGVLGGHVDGVTADAAIGESGLSVVMGDTILAAMEVAGAARRLPVADDGTELWVAVADADLAGVDPANAPTTTVCPTCGHERKIRRPSVRRPPATGTGRTSGELNSDGSAKFGKNELRVRVEVLMRDLGPGHDLTPGTVARELGRSSGAVGNAMARLTQSGVLIMTSEAPVRYALSDTAPAPSAEIAAFIAQRQADEATVPANGPADRDTTTGDDEAEQRDDAPATVPADDEAADTTPAAPAAEVTDGATDRQADDDTAALVAA